MNINKIFRAPYGFIEEKKFDSKESQIDKKFDKNDETDKRQDEKDIEHDNFLKEMSGQTDSIKREITLISEKCENSENLLNDLNIKNEEQEKSIKELSGSVTILQAGVSTIRGNCNNNTNEITNLKNADNEILEQLDTKLSSNLYELEKRDFALKTEIPSIDGLASEEWVNSQGFLTEHQDLSSLATKKDLETLVKQSDISKDGEENRKAIILENNDALMGKSNSGLTNIAMISKWNVADFGSKAVHCNLNGKFPRPTYNDNQPIAIAEDIINSQEASKTQFNVLMSKISQLEDKLLENTEENALKVDGQNENVNKDSIEKDFLVSGEFGGNINIHGKDIVVKNLSTSAGKCHVFSSDNGEITMKNCNYSGEHLKSTSNTEISIQSNDLVNIKDCKFNTNTYNQIEISLNSLRTVKGINIYDCNFGGKKSNNAISIFGLKDNAIINIVNCVFEDVSNPLRISNHSNAKNVTINIVDCKVNKWESNLDYHGFICFQDYTSKENEILNKQFSTMTVNFINLIGPNGKILPVNEQSEICGSKNEKQLVYVYYDKAGLRPYSKEEYPTVNLR